jgi:hypothetical protein
VIERPQTSCPLFDPQTKAEEKPLGVWSERCISFEKYVDFVVLKGIKSKHTSELLAISNILILISYESMAHETYLAFEKQVSKVRCILIHNVEQNVALELETQKNYLSL